LAANTIPGRLFEHAQLSPGRPAYYAKEDGSYVPTSWSGYADRVRRAGKALIGIGFEADQHVTILGFNRPEWVIMDVACMAVGGAPAGIYVTNSPAEVHYITDHVAAPVILVENEVQLDKVLEVRDKLPDLRWIVTMRGTPDHDDPMVVGWDEFLAKGDGVDDAVFAERLEALQPDDVATLIYTSGTTGPPKGVMLTHHNLAWTADQLISLFDVGPDERLISYLPLSHIAEQLLTIHAAITIGAAVYYAESIETLAENIKEVRPTVFLGVPRVWEKFQAGVEAELAKATGAKAKVAAWAQGVCRRVIVERNRGGEPGGVLKAQHVLADKLVASKVRHALGLDETRFGVSGAAPISADVLEFFAGFGIPVYEVYGQSEGTGPTTFNYPGRTLFGSVGPPLPGVELKLADDGEILFRGGNVFSGYYKNPDATAETLIDEWLYSGDLGEIDDAGFLHITGRKKDIIVTAGGTNIAPKNLEAGIKGNPLVGEAVVIGDRRKYLVALISLDPETIEGFAAEHGIQGPPHLSEEVVGEVEATVDRVNAEVARVEQIKKFAILPRSLSIEGGELTGTLKVKRNVVAEHFADEIEALYAE
jgi:long-chain acyl-CoA synthetase